MRRLLPLLFGLLLMAILPRAWFRAEARRWRSVDRSLRFAEALDGRLHAGIGAADFRTGHDRIDGEWTLVTWMMVALANASLAEAAPEEAEHCAERARFAVSQILEAPVRAFDEAAWGDDMLADLEGDPHDHVVLGYLDLALGAERLLDPEGPHAALHDRITAALIRRLAAHPHGLLETYPGLAWPPDNATVYAAIGLHARATGQALPDWLAARTETFMAENTDSSGLLAQWGDPAGGGLGPVRGSGTTFGAWILRWGQPAAARRLAEAAERELADSWLGFGVVREYPRGVSGWGDIDSGPVILGASVAATGFGIGSAMLAGHREEAESRFATAQLFGIPWGDRFLVGGPLGDAILLAMWTTPEVEG